MFANSVLLEWEQGPTRVVHHIGQSDSMTHKFVLSDFASTDCMNRRFPSRDAPVGTVIATTLVLHTPAGICVRLCGACVMVHMCVHVMVHMCVHDGVCDDVYDGVCVIGPCAVCVYIVCACDGVVCMCVCVGVCDGPCVMV